MKPHRFAQMVNEVRELAFQYGHMEQFRCRVGELLGRYIHVEHNSKGAPEQTEAPAVVVPEMDAPTICGLIETYPDDPREIDGVSTAQAVMRWFREHSRAIPADLKRGGVVAQDVVRGVTHMGISWEASRPGDYYWERGAWREWKADGQMANASSFAWIRPFPVRTIPADRLPGDGMVAVDREEWDRLAKSFDEDGSEFTENPDGDGVHAWRCKLCLRQTPGSYRPKPSMVKMEHFKNCPVAILSALRANQGGAT